MQNYPLRLLGKMQTETNYPLVPAEKSSEADYSLRPVRRPQEEDYAFRPVGEAPPVEDWPTKMHRLGAYLGSTARAVGGSYEFSIEYKHMYALLVERRPRALVLLRIDSNISFVRDQEPPEVSELLQRRNRQLEWGDWKVISGSRRTNFTLMAWMREADFSPEAVGAALNVMLPELHAVDEG